MTAKADSSPSGAARTNPRHQRPPHREATPQADALKRLDLKRLD
jgi:hypothetical protein